MRSVRVVLARGSNARSGRGWKRRKNIPALMESLEQRTLLAAVSWTGQAGDNLWTTARNWSNDAVPTSADDVTINVAGSPTINLNNSQQSVRSLDTSENVKLSASTLEIDAGLTLSSGAVVTLTSSIGALSILSFLNSNQTISGNGQIVFDGVGTASALQSSGALTIGSGVTVRTGSGSGVLIPDGSVFNEGKISAQTQGASIAIGGSLINDGALESLNKSVLSATASLTQNRSATLNIASGATLLVGGDLLGDTATITTSKLDGSVVLALASAGSQQVAEVMSHALGATSSGFVGNFAIGTLSIAPGTNVKLVDQSDNAPGTGAEVLYVDSLFIPLQTTLDLNGLNVYVHSMQT